jgi:hypothetical protein
MRQMWHRRKGRGTMEELSEVERAWKVRMD